MPPKLFCFALFLTALLLIGCHGETEAVPAPDTSAQAETSAPAAEPIVLAAGGKANM